jgi:hypothetical protein
MTVPSVVHKAQTWHYQNVTNNYRYRRGINPQDQHIVWAIITTYYDLSFKLTRHNTNNVTIK